MKELSIIFITIFFSNVLFGQVAGNINYQSQVHYSDNNIAINFPSNVDIFVSAKGLANVKADAYVAIFSVSQSGNTTEEVNRLMDSRIKEAIDEIKIKAKVETYVDMVSFVPLYEYLQEKKIFHKRNYNEIPRGFELKKNIHIKYTDPTFLNEIITILSNNGIYDLVRVDCFSTEMEKIKKELMAKAKTILQEKLDNYEDILTVKLDSSERELSDGYKVVLPVEMYKSYEAYNSSSLNFRKHSKIKKAEKTVTQYYQPILDKEFDFVFNPVIIEPVIQLMYEIKLKVIRPQKKPQVITKVNKEYMFITPSGDIKRLPTN